MTVPGDVAAAFDPELTRRFNPVAVIADKDVTRLYAGFVGRTARSDLADKHTCLVIESICRRQFAVEILRDDTEAAVVDSPFSDNRLGDGPCIVARNGESDSHVAACLRGDGRVDADHQPFKIHERTAAVPGVDGGIGLNEKLVAGDTDRCPPFRANDPGSHGLIQSKRAADRQHPVSDRDGIGSVKSRRYEAVRLDSQNSQITLFIHADELTVAIAAMGECHDDLIGTVNDVAIRQDIAPSTDDHAGPQSELS